MTRHHGGGACRTPRRAPWSLPRWRAGAGLFIDGFYVSGDLNLMERTTLDLWVGLFVVAGLAAVLVLAMKSAT